MNLRVDHSVTTVASGAGGVATAVRHLAESQAAMGCLVHVHALTPADSIPGVSMHGYLPNKCFPRSLGRSRALRLGLSKAARETDVLHSHNLWSDGAMYAASATRGTACRLVCSPHGGLHPRSLAVSAWRKRLAWSLRQQATLQAADLLHATSEQEASHCRLVGLTNPVVVIPLGVDLPSLQEGTAARGLRRLAFLGRLHRIKAIDNLLEAWKSVAARHPDWELVIRGPDGGVEPVLRRMASQAPRVTFGPAVSPGERAAWYRSCDLVVLPSHAENFGLVVAEALAAAVPVIASTGTPWSRLPAEGCGWWVDNDVDALAGAFDAAMSVPPARLHAMGARGRDWMAKEFTWSSVTNRMIDAYRWICGLGPKPPDAR